MQVDLPFTGHPRSEIEFTFLPELGDYKTINGEKYLNPWFNYTVPHPVAVGLDLSVMPASLVLVIV